MEFSTSITVGGQPVTLVSPSIRGTRAWQKANSVFCPLGPAHSEAWMLLTNKALAAVQSYLTADVTIVWKMEVPAPNQSQSTTLSMTGWRLLQAERLFVGGEGDKAGLFLCQFVDARYRAKNENTGATRANIRSYANSADYLTGTSGYTWTSLLTEIWNACGVLGAWPGLPAGLPIDGVPETQFLISLNAWRSLCTLLDQLDCAIKHNPLTNTYTIVQLGEAQVTTGFETRIQYNGEPVLSNVGCADTVRVHFFFHRKGYGQERDTELATNWAVVGASDVIELATGIAGSSGTVTLWDDQPWILNENEAHTNNSDNVTRADNRKARYVTRCTVEPFHKIYTGLTAGGSLSLFLPGGELRAILWRNWGDSDNKLGGTVTEIVGGPDLVTGFGTNAAGETEFGWMNRDNVTTEREAFSPPDYGRHSYPNYPRLPNIVQINHVSATAGDSVSPNADGFHKGRVRRWVANAMATLDDCWIRFVDTHDTANGQITGIQNEFYYGRLSGISTSSGSLLPVYLAKEGETADKLVRFRLSANLSTGGSAAANILTWDGAAYVLGAAITVNDWWATAAGVSTRGMWQAVSGMEGWCFKREVGGQYDIVWMETYAWSIECTGNGTLNEANPTASFEQGVAPPSTVRLLDDQGRFPDSLITAGGKFFAIRSEYADPGTPANPYYKVVAGQRAVFQASATLTADMEPGQAPVVTGWTNIPTGHFVQAVNPAIQVLQNSFGHRALSGEKIWLVRITNVAAAFTWEVHSGSGTGTVVQFSLTSNLTNGGSASANILTWNGAGYVTGAAITVFDWFTNRGMWQGVTGHTGVAIKRGNETTEYDIVWMETYAWSLEGTTITSLLGNTATTTVNSAFEQGIIPDSPITIHDDQTFFPRSLAGARVKGVRSEYEGTQAYYKVLAAQQMGFYATTILTAPLCREPIAKVDPNQFKIRMYSPFNQKPIDAVSSARNPFAHAGLVGDQVLLVWFEPDANDEPVFDDSNQAPSNWVIIDVQKHAVKVCDVFWDEPSKCLRKTAVVIAAEICVPPETSDIICAERCP